MILVFGQTGQVGRELAQLPDVHCVGREEADLNNEASIRDAIRKFSPQAIINAAAYTAVDAAEADVELAHQINAHAPKVMAQEAQSLNIPLVHISTDYVFDGSGTKPWTPDDSTAPLNIYGQSKRDGELAVLGACNHAIVLRTSWVFSSHGQNFVKTMVRLAQMKSSLDIVSDQIGGPTSARAIAYACMRIVKSPLRSTSERIYHFAGAPDVSWAEFAEEIFAQLGKDIAITAIKSEDFPTAAQRPLNSRLDCSAILADFDVQRPNWKSDLKFTLDELKAGSI